MGLGKKLLSFQILSATAEPQPLGRLITPIGFGGKALKSERYAVFDQTFFEKVCGQAFSQKVCVFDQTQPLRRLTTPLLGVFDQTFLKSF